jgi:hypothetical protein
VASTLRLPAIFLGGKTCCAFDCTPNVVDTAIEDKIKDRQKATLQATRVIHACRKGGDDGDMADANKSTPPPPPRRGRRRRRGAGPVQEAMYEELASRGRVGDTIAPKEGRRVGGYGRGAGSR